MEATKQVVMVDQAVEVALLQIAHLKLEEVVIHLLLIQLKEMTEEEEDTNLEAVKVVVAEAVQVVLDQMVMTHHLMVVEVETVEMV